MLAGPCDPGAVAAAVAARATYGSPRGVAQRVPDVTRFRVAVLDCLDVELLVHVVAEPEDGGPGDGFAVPAGWGLAAESAFLTMVFLVLCRFLHDF